MSPFQLYSGDYGKQPLDPQDAAEQSSIQTECTLSQCEDFGNVRKSCSESTIRGNKYPVAFKAQLCILSIRIGWVILQKKKKNPRTLKQQRFISHSQHMFTTNALGTLFPHLLPSHSKTQGNGAATIQNIAGGHGNVTGGLIQKLNLWPPHDMCPFCSKFISQRKSLAGTGHKGTKKYNPKMCPEGKKTEMTIWKKH